MIGLLILVFLAFMYFAVLVIVECHEIDRRVGILAVLPRYSPAEEAAVRRARVILAEHA